MKVVLGGNTTDSTLLAYGNNISDCVEILTGLMNQEIAGEFNESVKIRYPMLWPAYTARIKNPMDLGTVKRNL